MAKILTISVYNRHEQAELLYAAAYAVFGSLPPANLLREFTQADYNAWYDSRFEDTSDGWSSGPSLYVMPMCSDMEPICFILITPTSGRIIKVNVSGVGQTRYIDSCEVMFPSGSIQAAGDVVLGVLHSQERVGEGLNTRCIYVGGVRDDGSIVSREIDKIGVVDEPSAESEAWALPERQIVVL